ncbi:hypothetical protein [Vibrio casei]|uniref:hypothetical protein n=1 Tax=Vibrio casei TaxID=673372 RepID=UPI003F9B6068
MFTLDNLDTESKQEAGAWLHLVNPATGELAYIDKEETKPCRIKMKGWQSEAGKKLAINGRNKAMKLAIKQGKKAEELTIDDLKENTETDAKSLTELAIDWENIIDGKGKPVEFTHENVKNAMLNALDLRRQCLEFINDQKVFFKS